MAYDPESNKGLLYNDGQSAPHCLSVRVDHALGQEIVRNADNVSILKVEWCKRTVHPYHEFLVFYVQGPLPDDPHGPEFESVILVERCVDDEGFTLGVPHSESTEPGANNTGPVTVVSEARIGPQKTRMRAFGPPSLASRSSDSSIVESILDSSSPNDKDAYDRFAFSHSGNKDFVTKEEKEYRLCATLKLEKGQFSVSQLAVLADYIHRKHDTYDIPRYSCYFFAATIFNVVQKCTGVTVIKGEASNARGMWTNLPIHTVDTDYITKVKDEFKNAWKEFAKGLKEERDAKAERKDKLDRERVEARAEEMSREERNERLAADNARLAADNARLAAENKANEERDARLAAEAALQKEREAHRREMEELRRSVARNVSVSA